MKKKTFAITGMMCAGCVARVDKKLNSLKGVREASVNLASRSALIAYEPAEITPEEIKKEIDGLGYDMILDEEDTGEDAEAQQYRRLRTRMIACWLLAAILMYLSMGRTPLSPPWLRQTVMALIAAVVIGWCGRGFFVNAGSSSVTRRSAWTRSWPSARASLSFRVISTQR